MVIWKLKFWCMRDRDIVGPLPPFFLGGEGVVMYPFRNGDFRPPEFFPQ